MAINFRQCPDCGSKDTVKIVYGNPGRVLYAKAEAGLIRIGDGPEEPDSPEYYCNDCEYEWNRAQAVDAAYCSIKSIKVSVSDQTDRIFSAEIDLVHPGIIWNSVSSAIEEAFHKTISEITASQFADQLKTVHLLDWDAEYSDSGMAGVSQCRWNLEIITGEKAVSKSGNNKFPAEWDMFCREIQKLTGKNFF